MDTKTNGALGRRRIGIPALVCMIIAASAPLTVVGGGVTSNYAVTGLLGIPLSFVVLGVVLLVFAVGYTAMSRHIHNAGAFYAYIAQGLGAWAGIGAAWVALIAYNALQIGIYGMFGFVLSSFAAASLGVAIPWWATALAGWVVVGLLGINKVDLSAKVLGIIVALEFLVVIVYDVVAVGAAPEGVTFGSLEPGSLFAAGVGAALVFSIAAFMGFESGAIYNEEVKDPKNTARRATLIAIVIISLFYAFSAWAMAVGEGDSQVVARSVEFGPDLMFVFLEGRVAGWFIVLGNLLFITSVLAALIAFHNVIARYIFAMGREGALPRALAATNRAQAPVAGSLVQSVFALVVLVIFAIAGAGHATGELFPVLTLFTWLTNTGAFGLVLLMLLTSFAVFGFFRRREHTENAWVASIAPLLAGGALLVLFGLIIANFGVLIGLEEAGVLAWLLPAVVIVPGIAASLWGRSLRARRPDVYAGIGAGAPVD
ncbi:APC family permease [Zhihengliuella salsuginis]|uniref:Amino acid permease n=1 Tax=Zhihengliuella salsuginis TaxID=578222 RepID=A0ABQ3GCI5_9MICC|nr:APC family permease [Zhihengliuella salsuginis]GHD00440.1 amino acid permease [Zhihengliuella salsuginis]